MKKRTKIISAICAASVALSIFGASSAFAATNTYKLGDVNGDGKVTIADATEIQRFLVGYDTLTTAQKNAADVNFDGKVSIIDATTIQSYVVGYINSFYQFSSNVWTTSYTTASKTFVLNKAVKSSNIAYNDIKYVNDSGWITVSRLSTTKIKVTVDTNDTPYVRGATINVKIGDDTLPITIKQLGNMKGGYDSCYAYALNLESDPKVEAGKPSVKFNYQTNHSTPGTLSMLDKYNDYSSSNFTIINHDKNLFTDIEKYMMTYVKADMNALGWGIRKIENNDPNAEVAKGNWLIAFSFNPPEDYEDEKQVVCAPRPIIGSGDYHWYRRVDNADGSSYWTHKRGTYAPANLKEGETPATYTKKNPTPALNSNSYFESTNTHYNDYLKKYQEHLNSENSDSKFKYVYPLDSAIHSYASNYYLIGYYEVGPNV